MPRFLAVLIAAFAVGCASNLPKIETLDPGAVSAPIQEGIRQAQKSAQYTADRMQAQLATMQAEVQEAADKATVAAEEARRSAKAAAQKQPQTVIREKAVQVADAVFQTGDRESLLGRASEHAERLKRATEQLQELAATMNDMQQRIDGLREFTASPVSYVQTYGVGGLLALLMSIAAYLTGSKRRK